MTTEYTVIPSLAANVAMPEEGVLSKPVFTSARIRATLFAMSAGQELSEHTSTMEAVLQFLEGEAEITLGGERHTVGPGAWVRMAPNLRHSVLATQPLKMLLIVLQDAKPDKAG